MGIKIQLTTEALSSLIDQDPDFEYSLKQAILANVARKYIKGVNSDIASAIEKGVAQARDEIFKEYGTYKKEGWDKKFVLKPEFLKEVMEKIQGYITLKVGAEISNLIEKELHAQSKSIKELVKLELEGYTQQVVKEQIKEKFNKALKNL